MRRLFLLCAIALASCVPTEKLAQRASEHNLALEESANVNALMNTIRASKRLPMYHSRLGSMKHTSNRDPGFSLTAPLGALVDNDASSITGKPVLNGSSIVNMDALTGEEFYKSILSSITPQIVKRYRDVGWPDTVLFSLFIERIEFVDIDRDEQIELSDSFCSLRGNNSQQKELVEKLNQNNNHIALAVLGWDAYCEFETLHDREIIQFSPHLKKSADNNLNNGPFRDRDQDVYIIDNDPEDPERYMLFRNVIAHVSHTYDIQLMEKKGKKVIAYNLKYFKTITPSQIPKGAKIDPNGNVWVTPKSPIINFTNKVSAQDDNGNDKKNAEINNQSLLLNSLLLNSFQGGESVSGKDNEGPFLTIVLRSPSDMLYYLGEMVRAQKKANEDRLLSKEKRKSNNYIDLCAENFLNPQGKIRKDVTRKEWFGEGSEAKTEFFIGFKNVCSSPYWYSENAPIKFEDAPYYLLDEYEFTIGRPLFYPAEKNALFIFDHGNSRYWVPANEKRRGRTMQNITLINDIFFQRQKSTKSPDVVLLQSGTF